MWGDLSPSSYHQWLMPSPWRGRGSGVSSGALLTCPAGGQRGRPQQRVGESLVFAAGCHWQPGQGGMPRGRDEPPRASAALHHGLASSCTGLWREGQAPPVTGGPSSLHHTAVGTSKVLSLPTCPFPEQFSGLISVSQPQPC